MDLKSSGVICCLQNGLPLLSIQTSCSRVNLEVEFFTSSLREVEKEGERRKMNDCHFFETGSSEGNHDLK